MNMQGKECTLRARFSNIMTALRNTGTSGFFRNNIKPSDVGMGIFIRLTQGLMHWLTCIRALIENI